MTSLKISLCKPKVQTLLKLVESEIIPAKWEAHVCLIMP